jgi:hypothetical protein
MLESGQSPGDPVKRKRLGMAERQLWDAYGDRYPGSHQRWLDQAAEREAIEWSYRRQKAWALYRRVHGGPCQTELDRLEYEREVKARDLARHGGRRRPPKDAGPLWRLFNHEPEPEASDADASLADDELAHLEHGNQYACRTRRRGPDDDAAAS